MPKHHDIQTPTRNASQQRRQVDLNQACNATSLMHPCALYATPSLKGPSLVAYHPLALPLALPLPASLRLRSSWAPAHHAWVLDGETPFKR